MNEPRVSIIIPSMNEEKTIGSCIQKALLSLKNGGIDGEIIVSDSSSDHSRESAIGMGIKVVIPINKGYGNAYFEGIRYAKGDYFLFTDADDTYDMSEMPKFIITLIAGEADIVMSTRLKG